MSRTVRYSLALATAALTLQACAAGIPAAVFEGAQHSNSRDAAPASTTASSSGTQTSATTGASAGSAKASVPANAPTATASAAPEMNNAAPAAADSTGMTSNNGASVVTGNGNAGAPNANGAPSTPAPVSPQQTQVDLKAGAIDDNANFSDYQDYLKSYAGNPMRTYDVSERHVISVKDASGKPVPNTRVTVSAGDNVVFTGRTYANGQLLFHPKAVDGADVGSKYFVTVGDDTANATGFSRTLSGPWQITLPQAQPAYATKLDMQIILDTTGSMSGEISKLQATLKSISSRIQALPQQPAVHFGAVAFKDQQGSDYLTKKQDFTGSVDDFQVFLDGLTASGGGDIPEDDETAIDEALHTEAWDTSAPVHLAFLITDAPPHLDYPQTVPYTKSIATAQAMGVKFFTIGASGLPAEGEYFLRQLAQATMGQYLFITRGGDEFSGGGEVSATVDKFKEGRLDDIMVDVVKSELNALGGQ